MFVVLKHIGSNTSEILTQFKSIRQKQMDIFTQHLNLEMRFALIKFEHHSITNAIYFNLYSLYIYIYVYLCIYSIDDREGGDESSFYSKDFSNRIQINFRNKEEAVEDTMKSMNELANEFA